MVYFELKVQHLLDATAYYLLTYRTICHLLVFSLLSPPLVAAVSAETTGTDPQSTDVVETPSSTQRYIDSEGKQESDPQTPTKDSEHLRLPSAHHAWTRFQSGAWREMEITTESFDERGNLVGKSVTTQQDVLMAVTEEKYTLNVQATTDVSGQHVVGDWNTRILNVLTGHSGPILSHQRLEDSNLNLAMDSVDCEVWEITSNHRSRERVERVHYSQETFPYILEREVIVQSGKDSSQDPKREKMSVISLSLPFLFEGKVWNCANVRRVQHHNKGSSQSISIVCEEIPGGTIATWTTDFNSAGQRIRWSVRKLLDFGMTSPNELTDEAPEP